jgi:DNA replication protein DnaC
MKQVDRSKESGQTLQSRVQSLQLHGVIEHWDQCHDQAWLRDLVNWEEQSRSHRSLERRHQAAQMGKFKPLSDMDWAWPKKIDVLAIKDLMTMEFAQSAHNVILRGPNGVGKTMIAQNLAYQALLHGHTVLFTTAGKMLSDLAGLDSDASLLMRLRRLSRVGVLIIDEVGYLSYGNRHADLLFEVINQRHEKRSTILTTNRSFSEWAEVFPNAACVSALVDRLIHHAHIIDIEAQSYRHKEAQEQAQQRAQQLGKSRGKKPGGSS